MCLALPARIDEKTGDEAWVVLGDTRMKISLVMTPEAEVGDWVLVHAGFAIQTMDEETARETWQIFESIPVEEGGLKQ
jgi:hydrogenase expression/formation protein HypC